MPVRIPDDLPAARQLEEENIFVMTKERAFHQDIRELRIAVLNLMPTKIVTETQLLRLLGNTPLQTDIRFIRMASHESANTPVEHLDAFYEPLDKILEERFDGLVVTGAPVENIPFEEVDYWPELVRLMDWSTTNVWSTLHICWGAQAGLYHHYGHRQAPLARKALRPLSPQDARQQRASPQGLRRRLLRPPLAVHRGLGRRYRRRPRPQAARGFR